MTPDGYADLSVAWERAMTHCFPHRAAQLQHLWEVIEKTDPTPKRILEIGAGIGTVAQAAAERFPSAQVTGVDLDPVVTFVGQHNPNPNVDVVTGDVSVAHWAQRWPAQSFDVVFSIASLHYVQPEQLPVIAAGTKRLLRPGGVFINYDNMPLPADELTAPTPTGTDSCSAAEPVAYPEWDKMWAYFRSSERIPKALWEQYDDIFGPDWVEGQPSFEDFTTVWQAAGYTTQSALSGPGKDVVFVATTR